MKRFTERFKFMFTFLKRF